MKFSMTGQEKNDLLIEVTAWASLTVFIIFLNNAAPPHYNDKVGD